MRTGPAADRGCRTARPIDPESAITAGVNGVDVPAIFVLRADLRLGRRHVREAGDGARFVADGDSRIAGGKTRRQIDAVFDSEDAENGGIGQDGVCIGNGDLAREGERSL